MPREQVEAARKWCNACPVQKECLFTALADNDRFGIWGGFTPEERRRAQEETSSLAEVLSHFDQGRLYELVVRL
jgi:hypothetical protein